MSIKKKSILDDVPVVTQRNALEIHTRGNPPADDLQQIRCKFAAGKFKWVNINVAK
ncbi:hypothetical protein JL09_g4877 [Pichia kudriavzevii]|uniref:Uncharacterized protein n=1 Tax=Pichia kudriavzevii TaxID=4909 RepID=A0A099NT39_PICKU|nr:hypothetical protein JL09_g4877 [Pichia kudriavzevii]